MGILGRFSNIMAAKYNALTKSKDPIKEIDEFLEQIDKDRRAVKAENDAIINAEKRARRALFDCEEEMNKYQRYAKRCLEEHNERYAREFLQKKNDVVPRYEELKKDHELKEKAVNMIKQMDQKLLDDANKLKETRDEIKRKMDNAKAKINNNVNTGSMEAMQEKANEMLDKANALEEISNIGNDIDNDDNLDAEFAELMKEDNNSDSSAIDDELEAMKKELDI